MSNNFGPLLGEDEIPEDGYEVSIEYRHTDPTSRDQGLGASRSFGSALGETAGIVQALEEEPEKTFLFHLEEGYITGISTQPERQVKGFKVPSEDLEELRNLAKEETNQDFGHGDGSEWYGLVSLIHENDGEKQSVTYESRVPETVDKWFHNSYNHLTPDSFDPDKFREI